jgi:hypothetical protein
MGLLHVNEPAYYDSIQSEDVSGALRYVCAIRSVHPLNRTYLANKGAAAPRSCRTYCGRKGLAMANNYKSKEQPEKQSEDEGSGDKKPDFVIRARQGPNSKYFYDVGAIWKTEIDGKEALRISMFTVPLADPDPYRGKGKISMLAMVPKEKKKEGDE